MTHSIQDAVAERWSLALRPARSSDGDALQTYVRGLSPQSRYNRFLGVASELPASELARTLAANGRDTQSLLLTSTAEDRETVVGEARVALWCAKRAGEFSMSIADDRRHRIALRRYAADQRGDDRTGGPPRLSPWTRVRTAPRANSEAVGRRGSRPAVPEVERNRQRRGTTRGLIGKIAQARNRRGLV
jgi:hypothetical protein